MTSVAAIRFSGTLNQTAAVKSSISSLRQPIELQWMATIIYILVPRGY